MYCILLICHNYFVLQFLNSLKTIRDFLSILILLDSAPFSMRVYENLILVTTTGREVIMSNYKTVRSFYHFILCCCPSVLSYPATIYKPQDFIMHFNSFVIRYAASGNVH